MATMIGNKDYPVDEWPWLCDALIFPAQRPMVEYRCSRKWKVAVGGGRRYCGQHSRLLTEKRYAVTPVKLIRKEG